jgi:hypothetical protein
MSHLNDLTKYPIADFLKMYPEDGNLITAYPTATHWAINDRRCLVLYNQNTPLTVLSDFSRGTELE